MIPFLKEQDFEEALAKFLPRHGWEPGVIMNPTEEQLIGNWAAIIYNNNRDINRLNNSPLTRSEMQQIIDKVASMKSPYETNQFINGGQVSIRRDNEEDKLNYGKEVYLSIYDPTHIETGQSVYQIVRQPQFKSQRPLASDRRGDVTLLINGMPVIHIELKRSGVDVTQATNQIKKYAHEGVFSHGIYSLVQIFVAMTPERTLYFANPGAAKNFSDSFYFHWADFNNEEIGDWQEICRTLLSIPMAHQLIGYYTIADEKDHRLKVLRSYQYYAVTKIWDTVEHTNWDDHRHQGGYIWHTTGSGKTMTSFKAAQLIAKSGAADKVVLLLDRIELSIQTGKDYKGFANATDNVLETEDTRNLVRVLESDDRDDCLIVTSIQKMSRVTTENNIPQSVISHINGKRVVFIIDECHRSVSGGTRGEGSGMLLTIKNNFPRAVLFGFTGTPIFKENAQGELTTEVIFGEHLHKYTLAHGIPDGNVLGFDLYREDTFPEMDIREMLALKACGVGSYEEIGDDEKKQRVYEHYMREADILKIEDEVKSLYQSEKHHKAVMEKIADERPWLSRNGKFHAILATKDIPEAIKYYQLFKENYPQYNVVAVFDATIDNNGNGEYKEDAILEILDDYQKKFGVTCRLSEYAKYKNDVALRLAHKEPYRYLDKGEQIDLLIVVNQMLTGYDSQWINTLYVDKTMSAVNIIQSFSRTNRIHEDRNLKPFGIIKYFTRPNQMAKDIDEALKLYVDQPLLVFTDTLEDKLEKINTAFRVIDQLFTTESIEYYATLPQAEAAKRKFAKEFCEMTKQLEAAKMQGFVWENTEYEFKHANGYVTLKMEIDEQTYKVLLARYRELFQKKPNDGDDGDNDVYQLDAYITETGAGTIDAEYINSKFMKFVKDLYTTGADSDLVKAALSELHTAFAGYSQQDQRTAQRILHDIESGDLIVSHGKTIQDYILEYQKQECDKLVFSLAEALGVELNRLKDLIDKVVEGNINEGRLKELISTIDKAKAAAFLKTIKGEEQKKRFVVTNLSDILRRFILDPADRARIIYAYQNEGVFLDRNVPEELPQEEEPQETPEEKEQRKEDNKLSFDKMKENIRMVVKKDLRRIEGMPLTQEVVSSFFNILTTNTLPNVDGVGFDLMKAMDELFGRREVTYIDKQVHSGNLSVKFEVYLKKLYYMLYGKEVKAREEGRYATLVDCIFAFPCLKKLKWSKMETEQRLSGYLDIIRNNRNSREGNGAHSAYLLSPEQLDSNIQAFVTLYLYVTGMCYNELKRNYEI